jgi:hypothetical protein
MALAKRGAQAATSRANAIAAEQRGAHASAEEDFGPCSMTMRRHSSMMPGKPGAADSF